jgi:hypothetical protein
MIQPPALLPQTPDPIRPASGPTQRSVAKKGTPFLLVPADLTGKQAPDPSRPPIKKHDALFRRGLNGAHRNIGRFEIGEHRRIPPPEKDEKKEDSECAHGERIAEKKQNSTGVEEKMNLPFPFYPR